METAPKVDKLEAAVDIAVAACDGDLRATIAALVVTNSCGFRRKRPAVPIEGGQ